MQPYLAGSSAAWGDVEANRFSCLRSADKTLQQPIPASVLLGSVLSSEAACSWEGLSAGSARIPVGTQP